MPSYPTAISASVGQSTKKKVGVRLKAEAKWWGELTKDQQDSYIEKHPTSKYAKARRAKEEAAKRDALKAKRKADSGTGGGGTVKPSTKQSKEVGTDSAVKPSSGLADVPFIDMARINSWVDLSDKKSEVASPTKPKPKDEVPSSPTETNTGQGSSGLSRHEEAVVAKVLSSKSMRKNNAIVEAFFSKAKGALKPSPKAVKSALTALSFAVAAALVTTVGIDPAMANGLALEVSMLLRTSVDAALDGKESFFDNENIEDDSLEDDSTSDDSDDSDSSVGDNARSENAPTKSIKKRARTREVPLLPAELDLRNSRRYTLSRIGLDANGEPMTGGDKFLSGGSKSKMQRKNLRAKSKSPTETVTKLVSKALENKVSTEQTKSNI